MANTINAYDADVRIPQFMGLKQYGDLMNGNPVYAEHAVNMNTKGGVLMPMAKPVQLPGIVTDPDNETVTYPIETLMKVNRRSNDEVIVAAAGNGIYVYQNDGWLKLDGFFANNVWSWVDYEITVPGDDNPHDVILFSNTYDGMYMLDAVENTIAAIPTPYRFGVVERHAERIWGAGIEEFPDKLVYSTPYDPTDWCARDPSYPDDPEHWKKPGQPEDGAGEIDQPSWDGDSFVALRTFGDQLIAFKHHRVWRIVGTDPGVYEFKEQFGGGAYVPQTVAVDSTRIYMLDRFGVMVYDGNTVEPFGKEYAANVWRDMNQQAIENARACLYHDKYYLAIPMKDTLDDDLHQNECSAVVTYDLHDGTWLLRRDIRVESWLPCENGLYYTTVENPYCIHEYIEDAWEANRATDEEQTWVSPWNDLGYPHKHKGPFQFYFTPEVRDKPADFTITIDTNKKSRSKTVRIYPITGYEERMNYEAKTIRIPFAGNGRRFRVTIKADGGAAWRICGGVVIRVDQDTEG